MEEKKYGTRAIEEGTLETWPNPSPQRRYTVRMATPEFTCLCPRSGFPDFATMRISYQPREVIVELRSLKLYINKYRDVCISHEAVVNQILDDLVGVLDPHWIRVSGDFNVRGNVKTVITAEHGERE